MTLPPNPGHLKAGIKIKGLLHQMLGQYLAGQAINQRPTPPNHK